MYIVALLVIIVDTSVARPRPQALTPTSIVREKTVNSLRSFVNVLYSTPQVLGARKLLARG